MALLTNTVALKAADPSDIDRQIEERMQWMSKEKMEAGLAVASKLLAQFKDMNIEQYRLWAEAKINERYSGERAARLLQELKDTSDQKLAADLAEQIVFLEKSVAALQRALSQNNP